MRHIFLEKSKTNVVGKTIPRPFSKKSSRSVFIVRQVEDYQNILKLSCRPIAFKLF